jgi:opacity protein-like surface antigen
MRRLLLLVALATALFAAPADAQFFRNQGVAFSAGWLGLGTTWDQAFRSKLWNIHDQPTLGAGYFTALGYNLWFDSQVSLGGSTVRETTAVNGEPIFSLNISPGVRYNFLEERFRPFVAAHLHYLQIIPTTAAPDIPRNTFLQLAPFWVGARAGLGAEYIFADEQSVLLEANMAGFVGANAPPANGPATFILPASTARLSYLIYF